MSETAVFCELCAPAGGCDSPTFAVLNGKCDRCGENVGSAIGVGYVTAWARELWPRPIPVSERLPEEREGESAELFLVSIDDIWFVAEYGFGEWWFNFDEEVPCDRRVTHWLPLPPPPDGP